MLKLPNAWKIPWHLKESPKRPYKETLIFFLGFYGLSILILLVTEGSLKEKISTIPFLLAIAILLMWVPSGLLLIPLSFRKKQNPIWMNVLTASFVILPILFFVALAGWICHWCGVKD